MILFANNASTSLAEECTADSAYIDIIPGTAELFPIITDTDQYFMVTLVSPDTGAIEIMQVISVNGDRFNVLRAQEGTEAMNFPQNTIVENRLTAGSLIQLLNDTAASTTQAGRLRLATSQEAIDGVVPDAAISPYTLNVVLTEKIDTVLASLTSTVNELKSTVSYIGYPGEIRDFYEQTAPAGWVVADGTLLSEADTAYPLLWNELLKTENAWKLKTQTQWDGLHNAVFATNTRGGSYTWGNVGGVPFFVVDGTLKQIRVPDLRGMYKESSGFDGLTVGGVHGDMQREVYGVMPGYNGCDDLGNGSGCLTARSSNDRRSEPWEGYWGYHGVVFNNALATPVGNAGKPRAYGVLTCVCTGVTS